MSSRFTLFFIAFFLPVSVFPQSLVFSEEELEAYEAHKAEFRTPVAYLAADALASIQAEYKVNPRDEKAIRELCVRMETHKYLHNYLLETAQERLSQKRRIEAMYWDSITAILVFDNPDIAGHYVGYALCLSSELALAEDSDERLKVCVSRFARLKRATPCQSFAGEEMDSLKSILTENQIEAVVQSKYSHQVNEKTQAIWRSLESAGLTESLSKEAEMKMAATFYMKEHFIKTYYMDERDLVTSNLNDLYRHKPRLIRMYEGLKQKEVIRKRQKEKVGSAFSW